MLEYTIFQDGGSNSFLHIKSELYYLSLIQNLHSKNPIQKNGFLGEAYNPHCNIEP
jgi:hypothetical protein